MSGTSSSPRMPNLDIVTIASDVLSFLVVDTLVETRGSSFFSKDKAMDGVALAISALVSTWLNDWMSTGGKPLIPEPQNETIRSAIPSVMAGLVFAGYKKFMANSGRSFGSNFVGGAASIYVSRNFVADYAHKLMNTTPPAPTK